MSGYLQRLASRALNPKPSIHPVIDSIFSPARSSNAPESPFADEEQFAANWPQSASAPISRVSDVREEPESPESQPLLSPKIDRRKEAGAVVESENFFKPLVPWLQPPAAHAERPAESATVRDPAEIEDTEIDDSMHSVPAQTFRRPVSSTAFPLQVKREQGDPASRASAAPAPARRNPDSHRPYRSDGGTAGSGRHSPEAGPPISEPR